MLLPYNQYHGHIILTPKHTIASKTHSLPTASELTSCLKDGEMDRVMDARRKTRINRLQREVLVRMFRSGMRGCGKETLLLRQKAASETGLPMTSINVS